MKRQKGGFQGMQMKKADRILTHGYVITVDAQRRIVRDGAVAVRDGVIQAVGKTEEILREYSGEIYDCGGGVVHPGLIDAHEHLCLHITHGWEPDTFSVPGTVASFAARSRAADCICSISSP